MKHPFLKLSFAALFTSCAGTPPPATPPRVPRVVLVHGIFEKGTMFKPMQARLEKRGFTCYVPQLKPNDGRGGLEKLAAGLKRDIDAKFGPDEPIQLIGFSMGGLVSRYYLQDLGGAKRCTQFITISSPHNGTAAAWAYPSQGAIEMRPGSKFLTGLTATEGNLGKIPVTSYRTPMDLIILPPKSSVWERADNLEYPVIAHPFMLNSGKVLGDIERRLER